MSDLILKLSSRAPTRRIMKLIGLPTPQPLERASGALQAHPLSGRLIDLKDEGDLHLEEVVNGLGATRVSLTSETGEATHGLVYDATSIDTIESLKRVYDFLQPRVRKLGRCGRVILIARPPQRAGEPSAVAAQQALVGFTKSLAKELGRRGSTANLISVSRGAESTLEGPLRFLLSPRSAFVSGQTLNLSGGEVEARWTQSLKGKTALVTGAARGIGEATARQLAQEGARVIILDVPSEAQRLAELAAELQGVALPLDITDPEAASELIAASGESGLDVVVHNAGITRDKTLAKMSEDQWDLTLEVNLNSVLRVTQALMDQRQLNDRGRVVLVSSIAGIAGNVGQTNYSASKAGVIGLTRALAERLQPQGVACNAVAPGFIETRMTRAIPLGIRIFGRRLSNLNQGGLPVDIADAITFLSSPGAGGLHGNVLRVCGGNLLGA